MITPNEAKKLNEADQAAVERLDARVTNALKRWDGGTISLDVGGDGSTAKVRAEVRARATAAGWKVLERTGDQRDPGPVWDISVSG